MLIKSYTGSPASNYKAIVSNKVYPYLDFSILPTMEEISGSAVAKTPKINKQTAKIDNTFIFLIVYFLI